MTFPVDFNTSGSWKIGFLMRLRKVLMKISAKEILCSQNPNTDILAFEILQQSTSQVSVSPCLGLKV